MLCGDSEVRKQTHGNRKLAIRVVGGEEQNKRWGCMRRERVGRVESIFLEDV